MTKELIDKLIAHYEKAVTAVQACKKLDDAVSILISMDVHCGICACAEAEFGEMIYSDKWVNTPSFQGPDGLFWFKCPIRAGTIEYMVTCLQMRIGRMKTFSEPVEDQ